MARSTYHDFTFQERIGSGSFGIVWRARRKQDAQEYAIKEIDLQGLTKKVSLTPAVLFRQALPWEFRPHRCVDRYVRCNNRNHIDT